MKSILALSALLTIVLAEPPAPLSHSYLPPSPSQHNGGYTNGGYQTGHGLPQVVAARTLSHSTHGHGANVRSGLSLNHGAVSVTKLEEEEEQGYEQNSAFGRNSLEQLKVLEQLNTEPASYNFQYMVNDFEQGADFGHQEERDDEAAHGEYHVVLPDGRKQTVSYEADERGFKPHISYEDSEAFSRSGGYDANGNRIEHNGVHGTHGNGVHGGNVANGVRSVY